jgi:regulator of protease activity HflC (stomatin/prohibitin superfamily)
MDTLILFLLSVLVFIGAIAYSCFYKVKDIHIGLVSDFFRGRFRKEKDAEGNLVPLYKPRLEGIHLKLPWQKIIQISRDVKTKEIKNKTFAVANGTVKISGVIQYRVSGQATYRYLEVDEEGITKGLDSELDQIISRYLGNIDIEDAIRRKGEITNELRQRLTGNILNPNSANSDLKKGPIIAPITRKIWNDEREITYAEHCYGIEVLKASVDMVEPATDELKKARDDKQREKYEKESQTTEWNHYINRARALKKALPNIDDAKLWEAIQIWQKQVPVKKDVKEIKIDGLETIAKSVIEQMLRRDKT